MKRNLGSVMLFVVPSMLLILIFVIMPVVLALGLSLTDFDLPAMAGVKQYGITGAQNYITALSDPLFQKCLLNTAYFMILQIPITIALAMALAIALNRPLTYLRNVLRIGYFMPFITDAVAVTTVFFWLAAKDIGLVNMGLRAIGIAGPSWLNDARFAMITIAAMVVWRTLGYQAILFLAGLQGIPEHLYEAAEIDGANAWQKIRYVTIPLLRPTTLFVTVMLLMGGLQVFVEPLILTQGGPADATRTIVYYLYDNGFKYYKFGYAAAVSFILFAITFVVTMLQMKLRDKEINY